MTRETFWMLAFPRGSDDDVRMFERQLAARIGIELEPAQPRSVFYARPEDAERVARELRQNRPSLTVLVVNQNGKVVSAGA